MRLSYNWIKKYVEIPDGMDLAKLAYDLTMSTVEVEGMEEIARSFDKMVVGAISDILEHPDADKLKVCKVDIGDQAPVEIVCGGINLRLGMKVAVALPGAKVRWHGEGGLVEIGAAKVRGVQSFGMICASSEIGLFDLFPFTEEATVIDLSEFDALTGTPLAQALGLDDVIIEIDNKSMTNRPDLWGHYGLAREVSAMYNLPLVEFEPFSPPPTQGFVIDIHDSKGCPRYIGVEIDGVSVKPSPFEIQSYIWRVGVRPANAIVDITNYVMLATGQPTHAFDADQVKGSINVRRAAHNEKITLLNGKEAVLSTEDLVIADEVEAIALAGVMGGERDSILPSTRKAILEIANFDAMSVRHTAGKVETRTEAATRYEKAIDPERCDIALSLAMKLFSELFPGLSVTGYCDNYPNKLERKIINVSLGWLEKRLGKHISNEEINNRLALLGFDVVFDGDKMNVTAPTWRSTGDISIQADIMEEIARMYGYDNFEPSSITASFYGAINQVDIDLERSIKEYLAFRCGMIEIFTYPWMADEYMYAILQNNDGLLSLSAPPAPDESYLRPSLLPNLCKAAAKNQHYYDEFAIFETAQVFQDKDYSAVYNPQELLPYQRRHAAGAFVGSGDSADVALLYRKAKGVLEHMPRYTHMEPFSFEKIEKPIWADNVVWSNICLSGAPIGSIALLSKKATLDCGIRNNSVMLFEFDIDSLVPYLSRSNKFAHLPEYPVNEFDISMLFDASIRWEEMHDAIIGQKEEGELLQQALFVDEYRGKQVPEGQKSVMIRLVIGSDSKTLTSSEIESNAQKAINRLEKLFGAELRS
ncbi:MAG: phenylalanine--tRNA ligase subunit beta [Eubacteriaceae bacterium]|nr:phenylalanine--tRNA ligase subunit beta [Eubacteriaceae bacterium]